MLELSIFAVLCALSITAGVVIHILRERVDRARCPICGSSKCRVAS
jgi:hypothetical protein